MPPTGPSYDSSSAAAASFSAFSLSICDRRISMYLATSDAPRGQPSSLPRGLIWLGFLKGLLGGSASTASRCLKWGGGQFDNGRCSSGNNTRARSIAEREGCRERWERSRGKGSREGKGGGREGRGGRAKGENSLGVRGGLLWTISNVPICCARGAMASDLRAVVAERHLRNL